jgi:phosphatidyl-myo-inositol dimannoside synthase
MAGDSRCLLLTEVFPPQVGGSGKWLYEVYRRMPLGVVVAAGEHPQAARFDERHLLAMRRMDLQFPKWGILEPRAIGQYWHVAGRLLRLVREEEITAVHCGRVLPEGWLAWLLKWRLGLPYWVFVHGEELQYGLQSRQLGWMMRRVFQGAAGVIANSHNTATLLQARWALPPARVQVVHPGVDATEFVPASRDEGFRESVGWQARRVVLTVGRLQQRKGQDMLLKALPIIRQRVPDVLYVIVGDGEEREALEQQVRTLHLNEQVQFFGEAHSDLLLRCYQQCDLFVLPNREVHGDFEGFGMVLVEAQACGQPVIAGSSGGTRETMRVGKTGLIVDCTRPEPLAQAIGDLLLDPARREAMGRAGRQWVESHFDWSRLSERLGGILCSSVGAPGIAKPLTAAGKIPAQSTTATL